ncbi:hypothetical protein GH714_001821 [Hevea brasiliensis]|uniref:Transposase MuDR plant domain-containing protein n=1 Tax=Hevea brasiliensis TaxID=3981 RepID=A0A6A6NFD7_HEVBR|nr:hypothetical protein GH714_001821 [Hevea brasiliensis]
MDASTLFENDESDFKYVASNELFSESASENEAHVKYPEFNFARDINDLIFKMGMVFANNHEFKEACREYGIKHRYQIHFPTNDKKRVKATHFKKCGWYIWASKLNPKDPTYMSMQIKSRKFEHACGKVFTNFHITSKWLASHYLEIFRHDPDWSIPGIITRVKAYHTLTINPIKAWRARELALKAINGDEAEQYGFKSDTSNANNSNSGDIT